MQNNKTTITLKVEQIDDYSMYEFYEYGRVIGSLVVTKYGQYAFQVIHINFSQNRIMAALELLADEYAKKGRSLYCTQYPFY